MSVIRLDEYLAQQPRERARQICFFGPIYQDTDGAEKTLTICVEVKDGDVAGILSVVQEDGGILQEGEDGTLHFLPWPCAAVRIRDSDSDDGENPQPSLHE